MQPAVEFLASALQGHMQGRLSLNLSKNAKEHRPELYRFWTCERHGAPALIFPSHWFLRVFVVPQEGLEPPTPSLRMRCATSCATAATPALSTAGYGDFLPLFLPFGAFSAGSWSVAGLAVICSLSSSACCSIPLSLWLWSGLTFISPVRWLA